MSFPVEQPVPHKSRFLVWTDHTARPFSGKYEPSWFWSASGPRGHKNGCEETAESALYRAHAAMALLTGDQERKS